MTVPPAENVMFRSHWLHHLSIPATVLLGTFVGCSFNSYAEISDAFSKSQFKKALYELERNGVIELTENREWAKSIILARYHEIGRVPAQEVKRT